MALDRERKRKIIDRDLHSELLATLSHGSNNTGLSDKLVREIVEAVLQQIKPLRIILFGSRARGEWNDRSDIDIAVVWEGNESFYPSLAEERIRTLLRVDILDFRKLNNDFQQEIEENGIVIYEAS